MKICIPLAIQVVLDDVGWWSGEDNSLSGGPYRTGISRRHVPADYTAIVELGKRLGMRPQAAMIMCEWDRENILRNLPTSTWMGNAWDNTQWVGEWLEEAASIITRNPENIELTLHGVGHEYWDKNGMTRSEWYNRNGKMRSRDQVILHLEYFAKLLTMNRLGAFPESFVPAAFLYRFSPYSDEIAAILNDYGVKYVSTPFTSIFMDSEPEGQYFGTEHGILTVDRSWCKIKWCDLNPELTEVSVGEITGPICGLHWPNILHSDPEINLEVVECWVAFLQKQKNRFGYMLAKNTAECFSQIVYNWGVDILADDRFIHLDFSKVGKLDVKGLNNYFYFQTEGELMLASDTPGIESEEVSCEGCRDTKRKLWKIRWYNSDPNVRLQISHKAL